MEPKLLMLSVYLNMVRFSDQVCTDSTFSGTKVDIHYNGRPSNPLMANNCIDETATDSNAIEGLWCVDQHVSTLKNKAIQNLIQLTVVQFTGNNLTSISAGAFHNLPNLQLLAVVSNQLTFLGRVLDDLDSLNQLKLNDNRLQVIEDGAFGNLVNLHELLLQNNRLTKLVGRWFTSGSHSRFAKLTLLNLSDNQIGFVDPAVFEAMPNLKVLHLQSNLIRMLPAVVSLRQLKQLYLGNNSLMYLQEGLLGGLENVNRLQVPFNPWKCPCYLRLVDWAAAKNVSIKTTRRGGFKQDVAVCIESLHGKKECSEFYDEEASEFYNAHVDRSNFRFCN